MTVLPIERNLSNLLLEGANGASSSMAAPQKVVAEETAATACEEDRELCVWTEHNNCEEALGLVFEYLSLPQLATCAKVCKTFNDVVTGKRMQEHWRKSFAMLAAPGWQSSRRASSSDRAAEAQAIREDAARLWRMNVAGIWRVSGRTYASNEYQYLMHLHQSRDDDEEHNHPADFPLTYITGNDVSHDPDKEVGSDDESDEGPELNMHFRISGTLDGQTLVMTQVCRNSGPMDAMTWTNVCNATVSLDGNHMSGIWMQQDHRQMVIQRSRATGRFEAVKIRQPHELPERRRNPQAHIMMID